MVGSSTLLNRFITIGPKQRPWGYDRFTSYLPPRYHLVYVPKLQYLSSSD